MTLRLLLVAAAMGFLLANTAHAKSPKKKLLDTLQAYAATIRWGEFEQALAFVSAKYLEHHPPTPLALERYRQVRVSYYHDSEPLFITPDEAHVTAEMGLVNTNTQSARSMVDKQIWRWDKKAKHWWLMTGLPDITQR